MKQAIVEIRKAQALESIDARLAKSEERLEMLIGMVEILLGLVDSPEKPAAKSKKGE